MTVADLFEAFDRYEKRITAPENPRRAVFSLSGFDEENLAKFASEWFEDGLGDGIWIRQKHQRGFWLYERPNTKLQPCDYCGKMRAAHGGRFGVRYIYAPLPLKWKKRLGRKFSCSAQVCISCANKFRPVIKILEDACDLYYETLKAERTIKNERKT